MLVNLPSDVWNGTTQYSIGQTRQYTNTATTDANGRVTLFMTTNGLVGGTALFSSILSANAIGLDGSGNPLQAPLCFVESISTSQVVFRCVRGVTQSILLGGTINTLQYVGAGYTLLIDVLGIRL